jgi:transposase
LFRGQRTIKRWIKDYSERRIASIFTGHEDNENASKLTREQKQEIADTLKKPPSEYGLPKEFWNTPALKEYVRAEFGIIYESRQSYYFLLKFSNLSFKLPSKFDFRRDEKLIAEKMKEINAEIKEYLNNKHWEVFTADETRIQLEAETRKAWLRKGEKTIIKIQKSNEYQNYLGLLNQKGCRCHLYELNWQNQEEIIKSLKRFLKLYPNKKICVVWDNAAFHKGKLIRESLKKGKSLQGLHLINFPPYAPDKNPVEHIWKYAKQKISNIQFKSFKGTKNAFRKSIISKKFNYQM